MHWMRSPLQSPTCLVSDLRLSSDALTPAQYHSSLHVVDIVHPTDVMPQDAVTKTFSPQQSADKPQLGVSPLLCGAPSPAFTRFVFSNESGMLALSSHALTALNVSIISLSFPSSSPCFGSAWHQFVLSILTGYSVPILNAFVQAYGPKGAVKACETGIVRELSHARGFMAR